MENSPKIIIVIVNYNGATDTIECLKSIFESDFPDFAIIVVDNHSNINNYDILTEFCKDSPKIHLVRTEKNGGFAYGNNVGISYGLKLFPECKFYWLLNNDTKIFPYTINNFLKFAQSCPQSIGIMGNKMCFYDNPNVIQAIGGKFNKYTCRCTHIGAYKSIDDNLSNTHSDYVVGASMLVRKEFIESVGLMNEDYFLYFEELDWIERGRKIGWKFRIDTSNPILHKEGGSTNSRIRMNDKISAIQLRSRILFMKRFYPSYLPFSLAAMTAMIFKHFFKREFKLSLNLSKTLFKTLLHEK